MVEKNKKRKSEIADVEKPAKKLKASNPVGKKEKGVKKLQKETAKTRRDRKIFRQKQKPKYELTSESKKIWEKLRIQKNQLSKKQNYELVDELMQLVKNKDKNLLNLVYAHDTSRIIQTCLKEGSVEQRNQIFEELKNDLLLLSKNKYAKNILWKMVKYGNGEQREQIINSFKGHIYDLMKKNRLSASIIEYFYNDYANVKQRQMITRELCGKMFQLHAKSEELPFTEVWKLLETDEEKKSLLCSFHKALLPFAEKAVMTCTVLHQVFHDYFIVCNDSKLRSEMIESVRDVLVHIMHSREGAYVTMRCLWFGTKKDRKVILKTMKEFVLKLCCEEFGYFVLLTSFDCIDDTVFLKKAIINTIMKNIDDVIKDEYGVKVLIYLMSPRDPSHFTSQTIKLLEEGLNNPTSKKGNDQRHKELLEAVTSPVAQYLADNIEDLMFDVKRFFLIKIALTNCPVDQLEPLFKVVGGLFAVPFEAGQKDKKGHLHVVEELTSHAALKKIIKFESKQVIEKIREKADFSLFLLNQVDAEHLYSMTSCSRGISFLLGFVESECAMTSSLAKKMLNEKIEDLKERNESKLKEILLTKLNE